MNEGISCFERIGRELKDIIQDKSIDDIKGKLKMINLKDKLIISNDNYHRII